VSSGLRQRHALDRRARERPRGGRESGPARLEPARGAMPSSRATSRAASTSPSSWSRRSRTTSSSTRRGDRGPPDALGGRPRRRRMNGQRMFASERVGGIAALIAAATFVFGFALFATVLSDYTTGDPTPAESVAFLVDNQARTVRLEPRHSHRLRRRARAASACAPRAAESRLAYRGGGGNRLSGSSGRVWSSPPA
jgi:hypothetical protein